MSLPVRSAHTERPGLAEGRWAMPVPVRRLLMLGPPLLLAGLEILHPNPDFNAQALMAQSTWFAAFHVIQLVLVGLVALSVILLADRFGQVQAWSLRLGVGVFLVFFSAYDAVAGIGTGLAMRGAQDLSTAQQQGVFEVVKDWPGLSEVFALSIIGTGGWVVALGVLAMAARRQRAPRLVWLPLALSALLLMGGHPFPGGTLAFGFLFLAGLFHEVFARQEGET